MGYDYEIDTTDDTNHIGAAGRFNSNVGKIQVGSNLSPEQQLSTLLHEIIEALNFHLMLGMEERVIMSLEAGLFQVLKDNGVILLPLMASAEGYNDLVSEETFNLFKAKP